MKEISNSSFMRFNKCNWDNHMHKEKKMNLDPCLTPQRLTQSGSQTSM